MKTGLSSLPVLSLVIFSAMADAADNLPSPPTVTVAPSSPNPSAVAPSSTPTLSPSSSIPSIPSIPINTASPSPSSSSSSAPPASPSSPSSTPTNPPVVMPDPNTFWAPFSMPTETTTSLTLPTSTVAFDPINASKVICRFKDTGNNALYLGQAFITETTNYVSCGTADYPAEEGESPTSDITTTFDFLVLKPENYTWMGEQDTARKNCLSDLASFQNQVIPFSANQWICRVKHSDSSMIRYDLTTLDTQGCCSVYNTDDITEVKALVFQSSQKNS